MNHKVDKLLQGARDSVVGDVKPIPYYGSWKGFSRSGVSYINNNLVINNFGKNGNPKYNLDDDELEELGEFLIIILGDIIERGGVIQNDYSRVRSKLESIVGDSSIYYTARECPNCKTLLFIRDEKIRKYKDKFNSDIEENEEHSCEYSNEGEHLSYNDVNIVRIEQLYPQNKIIEPPEVISSTDI